MNENEKIFQYIKDLDVEFLNSSYEFKETMLSLNESCAEKSSSCEGKAQEVEKSSEGLTMKELAKHFKYAFLEAKKSKPVIISADLTKHKEQKLMETLKKYKETIAWSVEDLKEISPSICMHKILLEENAKTSIEHHRRLNPAIKKVVKKEVPKRLNTGIIYAISNNPWVSLVHVVLKKGGFTVIINENDQLIPTRTVTRWRVCIEYRKMNNATKKDYYPLPFINQMLDRVVEHSHSCFLDGYSGYN